MIKLKHSAPLWAFASVQFGKSMLWAGMDALTLYVLVRVVQLAPQTAGAAFFASSIFSALCDGAIGMVLARFPRVMRVLPLLLGFTIPICAASFTLLPLVPADWGVVCVTVLLMVTRGSYSLIDVAHNGLTGSLVGDQGHLELARLRAVGTALGALVIAALSIPIFANAGQDHSLTVIMLGIAACLAAALISPLPFLLRRTSHSLTVAPFPSRISRSLLKFCLVAVIGLAAMGAMAKALLHLEFVAANLMLCALLIPTLGRLAAVWLWAPVARRTGNAHALALALAMSGATILSAPHLIASGMVGTLATLVIFGLGLGGVAMIWWAVLSEHIKAAYGQASPAQEARIYGLFTMAVKIGLGASALLVGGWLSFGGQQSVAPLALTPLSIVAALGCFVAALGVVSGTARRNMSS